MRIVREWTARHFGWVLAVAVLMLVTGCASVDMAPPAESDASKSMAVPSGKALVYLYRSAFVGAAIKFDVEANGRKIGSTVAKSFFLIEANPGELKLVSESENTDELTMRVEAGQRYYVLQSVNVGFIVARVGMEIVPEEQGREGVAVCKLIEHVRL